VEFKYDDEVWNRVFADVFDVLKYYYKLTKTLPQSQHPQHQTIEIYKCFTFEEYLERLFLPYSADEEYQNYLSLLKTSDIEKKKIENKYSVEIDKILLMNHLVYLVNSLIDNNNNNTEIDSYINIIPFYEHIGAKGLTLEYIEEIADHRYETTMALDEIQEINVFNIIRKILL